MKPEPDLFAPGGIERLLERAERDPAASEELDLVADLVAAAERERARLAPVSLAPRSTGRRVRVMKAAAAAAVLSLVALGSWLVGRDRGAAPAVAELPAPRFVAAELRGDASGDPALDANAEFAAAMEPYVKADWSAAARALESFLVRHPDHGPARYYRAAALEQLGERTRAEEEYARAASAPDALLAEHARFRLAHLWLARGELERARTALAELRDGGGELARNAAELLQALERR